MELLKKLYEIHSPSYGEKKMLKFIKSWVRENVSDAEIVQDRRNIYITRGISETYPCIVAHTDQVQDTHGKDFTVLQMNDTIFAFSEQERCQQGLGADDKNGIWVALNLLKDFSVCKVALFHGEEIGCVGSTAADMEFFNNCRFVLQCDRKGGGDFITDAAGVELCSKEFTSDCGIDKFGYTETRGSVTDVMQLKENGLMVSACNISCGYYKPHTDNETTRFSELQNCLYLCRYIFEKCTKVYSHEPNTFSWKASTMNGNRSGGYYPGGKNYYRFYDAESSEAKNSKKVDDIIDVLYNEYFDIIEYYGDTPKEEELWEMYRDCGYSREDFGEAYEQVFCFF